MPRSPPRLIALLDPSESINNSEEMGFLICHLCSCASGGMTAVESVTTEFSTSRVARTRFSRTKTIDRRIVCREKWFNFFSMRIGVILDDTSGDVVIPLLDNGIFKLKDAVYMRVIKGAVEVFGFRAVPSNTHFYHLETDSGNPLLTVEASYDLAESRPMDFHDTCGGFCNANEKYCLMAANWPILVLLSRHPRASRDPIYCIVRYEVEYSPLECRRSRSESPDRKLLRNDSDQCSLLKNSSGLSDSAVSESCILDDCIMFEDKNRRKYRVAGPADKFPPSQGVPEFYFPRFWSDIVQSINEIPVDHQDGFRSVMIGGETGSGKSVMTQWLINRWLSIHGNENPVFLLDVDPGQPIFGAPACLSLYALFEPILSGKSGKSIKQTSNLKVASTFYAAVTPEVSPTRYLDQIIELNNQFRRMMLVRQHFSVCEPILLLINCCGWPRGLGWQLMDAIGGLTRCSRLLMLIDDPRRQTVMFTAPLRTIDGIQPPFKKYYIDKGVPVILPWFDHEKILEVPSVLVKQCGQRNERKQLRQLKLEEDLFGSLAHPFTLIIPLRESTFQTCSEAPADFLKSEFVVSKVG